MNCTNPILSRNDAGSVLMRASKMCTLYTNKELDLKDDYCYTLAYRFNF